MAVGTTPTPLRSHKINKKSRSLAPPVPRLSHCSSPEEGRELSERRRASSLLLALLLGPDLCLTPSFAGGREGEDRRVGATAMPLDGGASTLEWARAPARGLVGGATLSTRCCRARLALHRMSHRVARLLVLFRRHAAPHSAKVRSAERCAPPRRLPEDCREEHLPKGAHGV